MQDADRPADVQMLSLPTGRRCACIDLDASRIVLHADCVDGIRGHCGRRRHIRQQPPVRPPEAEFTVGLALNLIALFVDRTVMPETQHCQI